MNPTPVCQFRLLVNQVSRPLPMNDLLIANHLIAAPTSITAPDRMAVKRTPILSRMIPAKIRKNTNTLRNVSEPSMVPKALESQPRVASIRSLIGDRMSMKMYAQNIASASSSRAVHRIAAESLSVVFLTVSVIVMCFYIRIR